MNEIVRLTHERKAGLIVIAAPYRDRLTNPPEAGLMISYRSALRAEMQRKRIPFLEIRELTEAAHPANAGWFGELIHPNHMGHRLMTAEVLKLLASEPMLNGLTVPRMTP